MSKLASALESIHKDACQINALALHPLVTQAQGMSRAKLEQILELARNIASQTETILGKRSGDDDATGRRKTKGK